MGKINTDEILKLALKEVGPRKHGYTSDKNQHSYQRKYKRVIVNRKVV